MTGALDLAQLRNALGSDALEWLETIEVLDIVPSTNTWLMEQGRNDPGRFHAVLAERQTAGRGQRSRRWYSPPKAGICLSLGYTFTQNPSNLSCLTLAAGVAVVRALSEQGARDLRLKWPNDIYGGNAKLGGILTDAQSASGGRITLICGVGLNVDLSQAEENGDAQAAEETGELRALDYAVTDLANLMETPPDRSRVAAAVLRELIRATRDFEREGLAPFREDWNAWDWLKGRKVHVEMPDGELKGKADGIDANGALRVATKDGRRRVYTGTVRVLDGEGRG